jgi:hypothetical protein
MGFRKGFMKWADFVDNPTAHVVNLKCRDGRNDGSIEGIA